MKKNKVFVNKINKKIGHNQSFYNILNLDNQNENKSVKEDSLKDLSVREKLDYLFKINGYIFNVDVTIITNDKKYETKIAGKVGNHLITLDNNIINISDIKELYIHE